MTQQLYNTAVMVVANLPADSEDAAVAQLATALRNHGFDVITDVGEPIAYASAFVAEEGTQQTPVRSGCNSYPGRHWITDQD